MKLTIHNKQHSLNSSKQSMGILCNVTMRKPAKKFLPFNAERGLNHVDLHGLLVADEDILARDKEQLLEEKSEDMVLNIINERREQGDEALRKLKEKIGEFTEKNG